MDVDDFAQRPRPHTPVSCDLYILLSRPCPSCCSLKQVLSTSPFSESDKLARPTQVLAAHSESDIMIPALSNIKCPPNTHPARSPCASASELTHSQSRVPCVPARSLTVKGTGASLARARRPSTATATATTPDLAPPRPNLSPNPRALRSAQRPASFLPTSHFPLPLLSEPGSGWDQ